MSKLDPRPMRVLFLGHDSDHHNAKAYLPILQAALAPKGIYFTYTSSPGDLRQDILRNYDALMLYANHDEISEDQAKALLTFVKEGGAFIPIHSASYCFRNSEKVVDLIGGQFASHDTATFQAKIVDATHPAMQGVEEFTSWDETYVHTKLARDIVVLMERQDGEEKEPYTWVKAYGKGRVFYTALGHDERTWSKPEFIHLLEQGLRWALGERKAEALANLNLPELEYSEAKIPNYEQRNPPPMLQAPLTAEASQKRIQIPPGFSLKLFASEPDIFKPISAAWDERGRMWLLETKDYPNEIDTVEGQGHDRIKILEDTDGDGVADKFTVFADHLSVPTSMVFSNGGVIVSQAPHFLFLKDTDGDDVADEKKVLMTGWGTFDTHAGPSNLQYGFDNKIWGVVGYSSFEGKVGQEEHKFRQGAYRFDPDGGFLEFMGATSNNTWGLGFTEDFDVLISTANNTHSAFLGIADRYFRDVEGLKIKSVKKIDGHYAFHPNTDKVRQVDVFGGFTAAAGHHLYTARNFPREYWNRIALVCEPTGHLLHRAIIEPQGAGYSEKDGWNLMAGSDEWVSPVHAEVGPDGAVWILDWYNFIIQHNPTPPGFENGTGNAHVNPLRDKSHGRIYRLVYDGAEEQKYPDLGPDKMDNCVAALRNENLFWRLHAQRLLVENQYTAAKDQLIAMIEDPRMDALDLSPGAIHALWTLKGLDLLDDAKVKGALEKALSHPSASVRKNAIRIMDNSSETLQFILDKNLYNDRDAGVRLSAILKLIDQDDSDQVGKVLYNLATDAKILDDEWLARAVYTGSVKHKDSFTRALHEMDQKRIAEGYQDQKEKIDYSPDEINTSDWKNLETPMRWSKTSARELHDFDGIVWVRTEFNLPEKLAGRSGVLSLGPIDDTDDTYVNGVRVGGMTRKWNDERNYRIPAKILRKGKNQITLKIADSGGRGGIYGEKEQLKIIIGEEEINIAGVWKYMIEEKFRPDLEVFAEGMDIIDLFLKYYGPYAKQLSKNLPEKIEEKFDRVVEIKTLKDQMKYDKEVFEVFTGEKVKIIFSNNDGMQHNLLVG
ncbi:MAG: ThuA domain-containing protein, partial [Saprospiraceae bacterium]|nr:ThuA domain-containing protein [Saprospiraceae bacterium]